MKLYKNRLLPRYTWQYNASSAASSLLYNNVLTMTSGSDNIVNDPDFIFLKNYCPKVFITDDNWYCYNPSSDFLPKLDTIVKYTNPNTANLKVLKVPILEISESNRVSQGRQINLNTSITGNSVPKSNMYSLLNGFYYYMEFGQIDTKQRNYQLLNIVQRNSRTDSNFWDLDYNISEIGVYWVDSSRLLFQIRYNTGSWVDGYSFLTFLTQPLITSLSDIKDLTFSFSIRTTFDTTTEEPIIEITTKRHLSAFFTWQEDAIRIKGKIITSMNNCSTYNPSNPEPISHYTYFYDEALNSVTTNTNYNGLYFSILRARQEFGVTPTYTNIIGDSNKTLYYQSVVSGSTPEKLNNVISSTRTLDFINENSNIYIDADLNTTPSEDRSYIYLVTFDIEQALFKEDDEKDLLNIDLEVQPPKTDFDQDLIDQISISIPKEFPSSDILNPISIQVKEDLEQDILNPITIQIREDVEQDLLNPITISIPRPITPVDPFEISVTPLDWLKSIAEIEDYINKTYLGSQQAADDFQLLFRVTDTSYWPVEYTIDTDYHIHIKPDPMYIGVELYACTNKQFLYCKYDMMNI